MYSIPKTVTCPNCKHTFPFPLRANIMALVVHFWQKGTGKVLMSQSELKRYLPW
jgi:hypothetical protein